MNERITLSGVPEIMLQTLYARAKESRTRGAVCDKKAEVIAPEFRKQGLIYLPSILCGHLRGTAFRMWH